MIKKTATNKGVRGELCNSNNCHKQKSAFHFNQVTKAWYCTQCAEKIEAAANKLDMSVFYRAIS